MEQGFRGPQVCKIVGITYRQLDHWDRSGLLSPSLSAAKGSGSQRVYSYRDVVELRVIKQLLDAGVTLQRARRAVDFLRSSGDEIGSSNLVLGADNSVLVRDGEELLDVLRGGQVVFSVVPLSGVLDQVEAAILALQPHLDEGGDAADRPSPAPSIAAAVTSASSATSAAPRGRAAGHVGHPPAAAHGG
ncbi:MAG: MerR family transcriptional regulator [Acidimicrobiales bacterium]